MGSKSIEEDGIGEEMGEAVDALLKKTKNMVRIYKRCGWIFIYKELKKGTGWLDKYSWKLRAMLGNVGNILLCVTFEIN